MARLIPPKLQEASPGNHIPKRKINSSDSQRDWHGPWVFSIITILVPFFCRHIFIRYCPKKGKIEKHCQGISEFCLPTSPSLQPATDSPFYHDKFSKVPTQLLVGIMSAAVPVIPWHVPKNLCVNAPNIFSVRATKCSGLSGWDFGRNSLFSIWICLKIRYKPLKSPPNSWYLMKFSIKTHTCFFWMGSYDSTQSLPDSDKAPMSWIKTKAWHLGVVLSKNTPNKNPWNSAIISIYPPPQDAIATTRMTWNISTFGNAKQKTFVFHACILGGG